MSKFSKILSPARIIALGFASVILLCSLVLMLPWCLRDGVSLSYTDSLYTATSAVCVTGLLTVDLGDTFTPLGQLIIGIMIQIGGLGVTAIGAGFILAMGKKMDLRGRNLVREAMNLDAGKGVIHFIRDIFITTLIIELIGAILSFTVFIRDFPPLQALGLSLFHSVAAFNNSGLDILEGSQSLAAYTDDIVLNIITCALIFFGGIGFLVIKEIFAKKFRWKKFSFHTKVVLSVSAALLIIGAVMFKLIENISWLSAIFYSFSSRTAGFATAPLEEFSNAGLLTMIVLMFIGASPGSTAGGVKTSTFFVILIALRSAATNKSEKAFNYTMPKEAFKKAAIIVLIGIVIVVLSTFALCIFDPGIDFIDLFFESVSAFGTVGLSTGITSSLSLGSKIVSIIVMFIGRLGPLTIATLFYFSEGERTRFPYGSIAIG